MRIATLLQISSLVAAVYAEDGQWVRYQKPYFAAYGCKMGVDAAANFCGTKEGAKIFKCACTNENALVSWMDCGKKFYPHISFDKFVDGIISLCEENTTPAVDLEKNDLLNMYDTNKDKVVLISNVSSPDFQRNGTSFPITSPFIKKKAYPSYMAYYNRWTNDNTSHYMGIALLSFIGLVMILSGVVNWCERFNIDLVPKFIKKNFTLALLGKRHLHSNGFGLNPDRLETIFITFIFLYSLLGCLIIGYKYVDGDTVFTNYEGGTSRYYGDRAAIMVCYQLPLLFIFPGRNNFFQLISRWKYSRFITLHKWLARIIFMEILIHGCAMASQTYAIKKFTRFGVPWYREGITAAVTAAVIIMFAMPPFRRRYYEMFFAIHLVLVVQFLWLAWRHAKNLNYVQYHWACIAIWIFDRLLRVCRIVLLGGSKEAEIQYFPGEEIIKITTSGSSLMKPYPGAHAFVHFLTPTKFWQSHPFTVYPSVEKDGYIHFTCRVKRGITRNIADLAMANPDGKITMRIAIDGFYGEQSPYQNYDKVVLITGGTGLSGPFYHAKKLIETNPEKEVKLYWSVRTYQSIASYLPEIESLKDTNIKIGIYVSNPEFSASSSSSDDNKEKTEPLDSTTDEYITSALSLANVKHGRMSASEIVIGEINEANGSVAFGACAHTEVVDEVRRTVASLVTSTRNKIDYFEEMQMW